MLYYLSIIILEKSIYFYSTILHIWFKIMCYRRCFDISMNKFYVSNEVISDVNVNELKVLEL